MTKKNTKIISRVMYRTPKDEVKKKEDSIPLTKKIHKRKATRAYLLYTD